jgi:hypothetical protein
VSPFGPAIHQSFPGEPGSKPHKALPRATTHYQ